ncbi:MAG: GxGYxYP domain-containing protein [Candidatus Fimimonas sp.]
MNKKKFIATAVLALVLICCVALACACNPEENTAKNGKTGMFYKPDGFADKVYAIRQDAMSAKEFVTVSALQGILAQEKATIFIVNDDGSTAELLQSLSEKYVFEVRNVTDPWALISIFQDKFNGKYVLYNDYADNAAYGDQTINYAAVIAATEHYLPIAKSLEKTAIASGYTLGFDATKSEINTRYIFDNYKDKLSKSVVVHQNPTNRNLRDYAIAAKAMCFYGDYYDGDTSVKNDILAWADDNAPILGWTENEVNFVAVNSLFGKVTIAADHATNLSFLSASDVECLEQTNYVQREITPEKGKHYVAIVMSDGDNVQWMTKSFGTSEKYFGSNYRGAFPMTWTTSPSLYDLAPDVLQNFYNNATARDQFIAGPSGVGYVNVSEYGQDYSEDYAAYTAGYMEKTNLGYVNLLDNNMDIQSLQALASFDAVKGGVWSVGNKYLEGNGDLYWVNDKPFLTMRETLWRIAGDDNSNKYYGFVERVAQRINNYACDYTTAEGYTLVVAHAWSIGTMDYINRFVNELDEDVVLVTAGEMLDMISKYVPHEDHVVNDIAPGDIADLAPIKSEQYDWNLVKDTPVTTQREFVFSSSRALGGWKLGNGGLEYDSAKWVSSDSAGEPAIRLDGSDLEDVLDPLPNAWMYNMFLLGSTDNYLVLHVNGGTNADVNMRVRALYEQDGKVQAVVLNSADYGENSVNEFGWYLRNSSSPAYFTYDLSALQGKQVLLSVEQDDTGDGSGEIVFVPKLFIQENLPQKQILTTWTVNQITQDWETNGVVEKHQQGICLESNGAESSISYTFTVTEQTKFVKFFVRMFVRVDNPDTPPQLFAYANGTLIRAVNVEADSVSVSSDYYRCIAYDLSDFVGTEVTFKFLSNAGQHAAIGKISLEETCTVSELSKLYRDSEL